MWHELQGQSVDAIVSAFPQLRMASVHAALAYFWEHREEILHQMEEQQAFLAAMKPLTPSVLAQKLSHGHAPRPAPCSVGERGPS